MEQVKRVGHEMESAGNSVGWKGDDMGKVRKASMQVLEKRWHVIRSMVRRLGRGETERANILDAGRLSGNGID